MIELLWCFITLILGFGGVLIFWIHRKLTYWERRGLPHPKPTFFFGNMHGVFSQSEGFSDFITTMYKYFKVRKLPHGGAYFLFRPIYYPIDPEIIKHIMQNDFQHFTDRGIYYNEEADPLSAHLFSIEGAKWKNLRAKLTPTFTSGKLKMMFQTLVDCSDQLKIEMDKTAGKKSMDIKDILSRFTTDIIGSCAFGIECNSLQNPDTEFRKHGTRFFERDIFENMSDIFTFVIPGVMKFYGAKHIRKEFTDFFMGIVGKTVKYREENNIYRKDFMHLLLQLKNRGKLEDDKNVLCNDFDGKNSFLTLEQIAAQAFVFFIAGFETSSTTMTFCLYELASNQEIQDKLREEVNSVLEKYKGEITYDAMMEMVYMEKVINETLRKYPPLPSLNRICTKEYKVPGTDFVIEAGTKLLIPVFGLHRDKDYYPNPLVFDPERFNEENKRKRHPYAYLPFGEGPRICIGLRFGMMQTKVGLTVLMKNYKFSVSSLTQQPIQMNPQSFILTTKGGMWLDYTAV